MKRQENISFKEAEAIMREQKSSRKETQSKLKVIDQKQESMNRSAKAEQIYESSDYLFGDDISMEKQNTLMDRPVLIDQQQQSNILSQPKQRKRDEPIKRTQTQPISEGELQPKKGKKTKPKYKKADNKGNQIFQQSKLENIFKQICQPNRQITVNSLGHSLQRFKINFQVKDIVQMLELYKTLIKGEPSKVIDQQQDDILDLNLRLKEEQFKELYKGIRKSRKR